MRAPRPFEGGRRALMGGLLAVALAQALAGVVAAWLLRLAFDRHVGLLGRPPDAGLWGLAAGLAACGLLAAGARIAQRRLAEGLGQDYAKALRLAVYRALSGLSSRRLQARRRGGLLVRLVGDLRALRLWWTVGVMRSAVAATGFVAVAATLLALDRWLLVAYGVPLAVAAATAWAMGARVAESVRSARREDLRLTATVWELIGAMPAMKMDGAVPAGERRIAAESDALVAAATCRARQAGALEAVVWLGVAAAMLSLLLVGIHRTHDGAISAGTLVAAVAVAGLLAPRLRGLGRVLEQWHDASVAGQRLRAFLAQPMPDAGGRRVQPGAPSIQLEAVRVGAGFGPVDARVAPGARIALLGAAGAGKTTLLEVLARRVLPEHGRVRYAGLDVAQLEAAQLWREVALVGVDSPMLRGPLEAVLLGRAGAASPQERARVFALTEVDAIVARRPRGLREQVWEAGGNFSAGERLRIALARALLARPAVLLIDDAGAGGDPADDALLARVVDTFDGTVVIATGRAAVLGRVHEHWVLRDGRLVERRPVGTPVVASMREAAA